MQSVIGLPAAFDPVTITRTVRIRPLQSTTSCYRTPAAFGVPLALIRDLLQ